MCLTAMDDSRGVTTNSDLLLQRALEVRRTCTNGRGRKACNVIGLESPGSVQHESQLILGPSEPPQREIILCRKCVLPIDWHRILRIQQDGKCKDFVGDKSCFESLCEMCHEQ